MPPALTDGEVLRPLMGAQHGPRGVDELAWVQGDRFGVAFEKDIDPKVARAPAQDGEGTPRFVKPILPTNRYVDEEREVRSI